MRKVGGRWLLVVAMTGILALGLVSCGGNATTPDEPGSGESIITGTQSGTVGIDLLDSAFATTAVTIEVGSTVVWANRDAHLHTVTADDDSWDSGPIDVAGDYRRTFDEPGTFTYHCSYHRWMKATVTVE